MFRMIGGTLVALYCILLIFGDEERRPDVVAEANASAFDFSLANWIQPVAEVTVTRLPMPETSDLEAVEIALAAGDALREERAKAPLIGAVVAVAEAPAPEPEPLVAAVEAPTPEPEASIEDVLWYVTGTTVNVRAGPGTENPVITQVRLGDAAEVLSQSASGWVEIKPDGTETVGWISGRFLTPDAPG